MVAARLEKEQIGKCRARWRQGLLRGAALSRSAYNYVKSSVVGFEASPIEQPVEGSPDGFSSPTPSVQNRGIEDGVAPEDLIVHATPEARTSRSSHWSKASGRLAAPPRSHPSTRKTLTSTARKSRSTCKPPRSERPTNGRSYGLAEVRTPRLSSCLTKAPTQVPYTSGCSKRLSSRSPSRRA